MWWPILAFAGIGFEHVVANMFYIPLGCVASACSLRLPHRVGLFVLKRPLNVRAAAPG